MFQIQLEQSKNQAKRLTQSFKPAINKKAKWTTAHVKLQYKLECTIILFDSLTRN